MVALHEPLDPGVRNALKEYDELIAGLLVRRNIHTKEAAEAFLSPSYDLHLLDPLLMKDMRRAVERIADAIDKGERIAVWSDYDCDGIPGGVLLHDCLAKLGASFTTYVPHRHLEGYGLNQGGIDTLARQNTTLIITVDCGITDSAQVAYAATHGIDVIITDHHLPQKESEGGLPPAYAIIDPKREDETYPFRDFCGGGLAFKLSCALLQVGRERGAPWVAGVPEGWEKWLLDMAALSTIADMVPLVGENRIIAYYGLMVMRKSPRIGLQKLLKVARVDQRYVSEEDVGFTIAPRINAAGRMGDPRLAFELLSTTDEVRAEELAKELEKINRSRRASAGAITRAAHERIAARAAEGSLPDVLVIGDPEWRPGLAGLVAASLAEEYERPVFLWGREGGTVLKGSCRAGRDDISVVALMEAAAECFSGFGGHRASGGFSIKDDKVFELEEQLNRAFALLPKEQDAQRAVRADASIALTDATHTLLTRIARLAPFGVGNEKPIFSVRGVRITSLVWFGKSEEHLKVALTSDGFDAVEGVAFFAKRELGSHIKTLKQGREVSVLGTLERDQFTKGRPVRLRLVSIS